MASKAMSFQFLLAQVRNITGALNGGTATFYEAGTANLKTIWLDRDKDDEAANPFDLDANGTAQLFGDGIYDVLIKNSAGSTIYTREGISAVDLLSAGVERQDSDFASLNAAITEIGATPTTLNISTSDFPMTTHATIPSTLALKLTYPGSIDQGVFNLTINSTLEAGEYQIFTGSGAVSGLREVSAGWFGMTTTSSEPAAGVMTANTSAFNSAIECIPDGQGAIYLPGGNVYFNGLVGGNFAGNTQIYGKGEAATQLHFVEPSSGTIFLDIANVTAASILYNVGLHELGIVGHGLDASTAIRISDGRHVKLNTVRISSWSGNSSVGLQTRGRDFGEFENVEIIADVPIQISENPNLANGGIDHCNFNNMDLFCTDPTEPIIKCDTGIALSAVSFDGHQAWLGGSAGFYAPAIQSILGLSFDNVRRESDGVNPLTGYTFDLQPDNTNKGSDITFNNCLAAGNGWKTRNCFDVVLLASKFVDASGVAFDADSTCSRINFYNWAQSGGTMSMVDLQEIISAGSVNAGGGVYIRPFAYYAAPDDPTYDGIFVNGVYSFKQSFSLANGATWTGPALATRPQSFITATAVAATGEFGAGTWANVSPVGLALVSGSTTNASDADDALKLCVFQSAGTVVVKNNLGATVNVILNWN